MDTDGLDDALGLSPVPLRTMGRGYPEERAYFLAAAAAGRFAALRVPVPEDDRRTTARAMPPPSGPMPDLRLRPPDGRGAGRYGSVSRTLPLAS